MLDVTILTENKSGIAYNKALHYKKLFEKINTVTEGKVLIASNFTCYGFKENKDVDLLIIGEVVSGYLRYDLIHDHTSNLKSSTFINSFCFTIKIIDPLKYEFDVENNDIYIQKDGCNVFNISEASSNIKNNVKHFLNSTTDSNLYICDLILLDTNKGKNKYSKNFNTIRNKSELNIIFQKILDSGFKANKVFSKKTNKESFRVNIAKQLDLEKIEKSLDTFSLIKKHCGALTKKKINEITKKVLAEQKYAKSIGKMPVIIRGSAGSGKTTLMLRIAEDLYRKGYSSLFLTFNQSLVKDLTRLLSIAGISNTLPNNKIQTDSLDSFIYNSLYHKLGISTIINYDEIKRIEKVINNDKSYLENSFISLLQNNVQTFHTLKKSIQKELVNNKNKKKLLDTLDAIQYKLDNTNTPLSFEDLERPLKEYLDLRKQRLIDDIKSKIYLKRLSKIKEEIYKFLNNDYSLITNKPIQDQCELLEILLNSSQDTDCSSNSVIDLTPLIKQHQKYIKNIKQQWGYLLIDEAQDWNPIEREIIYTIFGHKRIIISDGLQQQLVKSQKYLDWTSFKQQKIPTHPFSLNKSFRQKINLSNFQNSFAKHFNINWNIKSDDRLQKGRIIISTLSFSKAMYHSLQEVGKRHDCDHHDSIIFLAPHTLTDKVKNELALLNNDNDVILEDTIDQRRFKYKIEWETEWETKIWDGTEVIDNYESKKPLPLPKNGEHRVYNYESCRGLEAWTSVCLDMDVFYSNKVAHYRKDDTTNALFEDHASSARKYAANWCLIAMSRAVDTLFISIENKNSEFATILREITRDMGESVKWIE
ncbi:UvrD-helicase domain-containing protein [Algivirga pacifica]|uniref:UvrD-like helicase ATP-binding domain-containing protein n=1 Tax=Algivirga pacifica TaxID=1162670 RepID=A0ABP9DL86_9BACT